MISSPVNQKNNCPKVTRQWTAEQTSIKSVVISLAHWTDCFWECRGEWFRRTKKFYQNLPLVIKEVDLENQSVLLNNSCICFQKSCMFLTWVVWVVAPSLVGRLSMVPHMCLAYLHLQKVKIKKIYGNIQMERRVLRLPFRYLWNK